MPIMECVKDGKPGFKWGEQGVCFIGEGAQEKAASVGHAIFARQNDGNLKFDSKQLSENKSRLVQVAKVGTFNHAVYGEFSITLPELQQMQSNFENNVRRQKLDEKAVLPFDYRHEEEDIAAGWITSLTIAKDENNVDSLFAEVEWTPEGAKKIKDNEFKFVSPSILRNYKDVETKEVFNIVLKGATLTNTPFLRDMKAITLLSESRKKAFESLKTSGDESGINLNIGQKMTLAEMIGGLASLSPDDQKKLFENLGKRMKKEILTQDKKLSEDLEKSKKDLTANQDKLKLSEKELKGLKEKMGDSKDLEDRFKLSEGNAVKLSEKVNSLTATLAENESKGKFDAMLSEGKACEAQRKAYMSGNMEEFVANAEVIKLDEEGQRTKGDETVDNAAQKVEKLAEEKAKSDNISFGDATKLVLSENPKLRTILGC